MRPLRRFFCFIGLLLLCLVGGWWYRATRPAYRLRQGQEAVRAGDFIEAEQYATRLEAAGAQDHFHLLKGEIALRQNAPAMALAHFNDVQEQGDLRVEAAMMSARTLIAMRQPRAAEGYLLFVLERQPDHTDAHRWLATIYYDQGDSALALNHLSRVAQLDARDGRPHRLIGLIHKDMEDFAEAADAYRESLRRDPTPKDADEVRIEFAECLLRQGEHAAVLDALSGVGSAGADGLRAEAMIALGREADADALLDAALAKSPDDDRLLKQRGERLLASGNPSAAARLLEKAVARAPHDQVSGDLLARAYEALARPKDAAEQRRRVEKSRALTQQIQQKNQEAMKDPWAAQVRYQLADLFDSIGRKEMARMWRRAAKACEAQTP